MGDSQILGIWTRSERRLNILELKAVMLALQHWVSVLHGLQVLIATDNITVVAYINKQGGTHSHVAAGSGSVSMATDLRFSHPGQTHSRLPKCDSRMVISAEPALHNRVASLNQIFRTWGTPAVDTFATVHNKHWR